MQRTIYINSSDRDLGGADEDFTITKDSTVFSKTPTSAKLVGVSIPYTWNNVTSSNNAFTITETAVGSDTFIIPPGNYDGSALAAEVQSLINASGVITSTFTVVFDSTNMVFTISSALNTFQIIFAAIGSCAELLGFSPDTSNPGAAALTVSSTGMVQLLPDYEIFVCSDLVAGSDNGVMVWSPNYTPTVSSQSQIMGRIPITACYSGIINYCLNTELPFYSIVQSNFVRDIAQELTCTVRFFLALPSGIPVDLNGYHWSAEVVLKF
jgi:hypothetical protein